MSPSLTLRENDVPKHHVPKRDVPKRDVPKQLSAVPELESSPDEFHDAYVLRDRAPDRALLEHFAAARRRARGPIVCVNGHSILAYAAGSRLVQRDDRQALWAWARRAIDADDSSVHGVRIGGLPLSAQCEGVFAGSELVGALIRLSSSASSNRGRTRKVARATFGWESLRESELGIAQLVAAGLTNREVGARLFLSRHTVDFHLRQIFCKLGISSRVELTRLVIEHGEPLHAAPSELEVGPINDCELLAGACS